MSDRPTPEHLLDLAAIPHHEGCTGAAASWCPVCGDCTCPREVDGSVVERLVRSETAWAVPAFEVVHDPACPLHGERSTHGGDRE